MTGWIAAALIKPRRPRLLLQSLALALLLSAAAVVLVQATTLGRSVERTTLTTRYDVRGTIKPPRDIVVISIGRREEALLDQWPLSRRNYADAVHNLSEAGVAGIAIATPMNYSGRSPGEDAEFLEAVEQADVPVVLMRTNGMPRSLRASVTAPSVASDGRAQRSGLAGELLARVGTGATREQLGRAPRSFDVNFLGARGSFRHLSFSDVSFGLARVTELRGALVVIGPTEGRALEELDVPIGGGRMPRAEVEANALANLRDGAWLRAPSEWLAPAAAAALALAVWALVLVLPLGVSVPASLALLGGWVWCCFALFERGVAAPLVAPLLAGGSTFVALTLVLSVLSVRDRRRVKGLFARYVPADVVRELVDSEDRIEVGGEQREITVLFSDIRGFTAMSEQVDAAEMVAQLNEYFEAMVEEVARHDGTVDKFLGDGLMAIFGAPIACADHAARACHAALAMIERLEHVNARRSERGLVPLQVGIGVHTGLAVVGNVGSPPFRVDFTAIGDTVNLASRVEAMTKELDDDLVVTAATAAAASASDEAFEQRFTAIGSVVVRGRNEPTELFGLRADEPASSTGARDAA